MPDTGASRGRPPRFLPRARQASGADSPMPEVAQRRQARGSGREVTLSSPEPLDARALRRNLVRPGWPDREEREEESQLLESPRATAPRRAAQLPLPAMQRRA